MADVVLRISGSNAGALAAVKEFAAELRGLRVESNEVSTATKAMGATVEATAAKNVSSAIEQRDSLRGLIAAYHEQSAAVREGYGEQARLTEAIHLTRQAEVELGRTSGATVQEIRAGVRASIAAEAERRESVEATIAAVRELRASGDLTAKEVAAANHLLARSYEEVGAAARVSGGGISRGRREEAGIRRGFESRVSGIGGWLAGPGFIGGALVGIGVDKAIRASLEAATSINRLDQAIRNARADVKALTPVLEEYEATSRKLGFTDTETRDAETRLIQAFGATKKSLEELHVAQDLARAKRIDLGTATRGLILLQEGNTRAAKEFGLALPDMTQKELAARAAADGLNKAQERGKLLYEQLTPRIRDQARAFAESPAGKIAEFHAQVDHLEETIGRALLPTVSRYLDEVDAWLSKEDNQKRVTHDVMVAVHDLGDALHTAAGIVHDFRDVADPVTHLLGGWKNVIETLVALKFASVVAGWLGPIGRLIGGGGAEGAEAKGLSGAASLSERLRGNLGALAKIGGLALGVDLLIKARGDKGAKGFLESLFGAGLVGFTFGGPVGAVAAATVDLIVYASTRSGDSGKRPVHGDRETGVGSSGGAVYKVGNQWYERTPRGVLKITPAEAAAMGANISPPGVGEGPGGQASTRTRTPGIVGTAEWASRQPGASTSYRFGGTPGIGPGTHTDCSGFTEAVYARNGINIPRTSQQQYARAPIHPKRNQLRPGDLVFFDYEGPHSHVGIYVGGGAMIADQHTGSGIVRTGVDWAHFDGAASYSKMPRDSTRPSDPYGPSLIGGLDARDTTATTATPHPTTLAALGVPESLQRRVSTLQSEAQAAGRRHQTGREVGFLEEERRALEQEVADLRRKIRSGDLNKAQRQAARADITKIEGQIRTVGTEIEQALVVVGDALIPKALREKVKAAAAKAKDAIASAQASTGDDVGSYYAAAVDALQEEQDDVRQEIARLRRRMRRAGHLQREAIKAEIKKLEGSISSIGDSIRSALEAEQNAIQSQVGNLQSAVSSAWGNVQQGILGQFEATTQAMIDAVGKQFFQGARTPAEMRLAAVQAADQAKSLQDSLAQAQAQLAADLAGTGGTSTTTTSPYDLLATVYGEPGAQQLPVTSTDATAGTLDQQKIDADRKAIAEAQHQIELAKLESDAQESRIAADADYAAAVAKIQRQREREEEHLTVALARFGDGLQAGTKSYADLQPLLDKYGVQLSDISDGSFVFKTNLDDLAASAKALDNALRDLAIIVSRITGKKVDLPPATSAGPPGNRVPGGHFAGGGIIPGPMIGPEDTVQVAVSTGEAVLSRDELRLLVLAATHRPAAAAPSTGPIYVLGTTKDEVGRALARIITPAQNRAVGFKNY